MKVSEVIRELNIGDEVWLKGKINDKVLPTEESGCSTIYPIHVSGFGYIGKDTQIVVDQPEMMSPSIIEDIAQEYDVTPEQIREWLDRGHAGSFTKMEVPDFVAEWYEENKDDINQAMYNAAIDIYSSRHTTEFEKWFSDSRNDTYGTIVRMKDGYTVKPKRWVVKTSSDYYFQYFDGDKSIPLAYGSVITKKNGYYFTDKGRAKNVADLIKGSVE